MSVRAYREALQSLFTDTFGLPAYLSYQLPQEPPTYTEFPYITYAVNFPEGCQNEYQPFIAWFHNGPGGDATGERADFEDAVQAAIPPEGITLRYGDNGVAQVYRGGTVWMHDFQDYVDKNIIGVKVTLMIRLYE